MCECVCHWEKNLLGNKPFLREESESESEVRFECNIYY